MLDVSVLPTKSIALYILCCVEEDSQHQWQALLASHASRKHKPNREEKPMVADMVEPRHPRLKK